MQQSFQDKRQHLNGTGGHPDPARESSNQWKKSRLGGSNVASDNAFKILQRSQIQTLLRLAEPRSGQGQTAPMAQAR
jgi:hypothetical protein